MNKVDPHSITKIETSTQGFVGYMHEIKCESEDSILIFQMPRETRMLSEVYIEGALRAVKSMLPAGRKCMVIGADVNIYELCGEDAVVLKLKGVI